MPAPRYPGVVPTDPHPLTGDAFASPVPPGSGWPGDPATAATPVAQTAEDVTRLAVAATDLTGLDAAVSVCRACPRLVDWRESVATTNRRASFRHEPYWGRPVPSFGDPQARALIVGLAPAANGGNRTGRVFTGDRSGDWLFAALHRTGFASQPASAAAGDGLHLANLRITAAVHCAPPQNKPATVEKTTCSPWLDRELELSPDIRAIMALGGIGWDAALAAARRLGWRVPRPKPRFGHGATASLEASGRAVTLVGCYHVSQQNTFTGRLTEQMLDDVLAQVRDLIDSRG